ncbi:MAG: TDT family transporter [Methanomassiliicoccus sp.]|nr:TDT family transporter [Methanomassiliicoccus sp.]
MWAPSKDGTLSRIASKTPIPLSGLMLGLSSTGNMVPEYRWFFGFFAFSILAVLLVKVAYDWGTIRDDLKNPAVTGIACTFPMAVAVLSTYIRPYQFDAALAMWVLAMLIHIALMVYFTGIAILRFDIKKCLPCYFIVYVGFSVNAFIAPVYGHTEFGQALFWFGLGSFLALFPPLLYRVLVVKGLQEPMVPTVVIFASPASVVLYGYLRAYGTSGAEWMVWLLLAFSLVFWIGSLTLIPRVLRMKFYPSYSSLTFPLVITGIATNATCLYFRDLGNDMPALQYLAWASIALAVMFVLYVLVRYVHHFIFKGRVRTGLRDAVPGP